MNKNSGNQKLEKVTEILENNLNSMRPDTEYKMSELFNNNKVE